MSTDQKHTTAEGRTGTSTLDAVTLFVRMWAIAHIVHLLVGNRYALDTPWNTGVVAVALLVIIRPGSTWLLGGMATLQLADYFAEMPMSPDHWALISFVNMAILITLVARRSSSTSGLDRVFPAARALLLVAYSSAALSKYNVSFLDPVTSCANAIAKTVSYSMAPQLTDSAAIGYVVMTIETSVAVLLIIPRTRWAGVLLGLSFHFVLSATPSFVVTDFTATAYALFLLFLPNVVVQRMVQLLGAVASRSAIVRDARRLPIVSVVAFFVLLGLGGHVSFAVAAAVGFVLVQAYLLGVLVAAWCAIRPTIPRIEFGRVRAMHVPVLALALLWALSPYLGLRTTGVFTMFSNIRTESVSPNHLFMPSLRLTNWQDQMVRVQSSNEPALQSGVEKELSIPLMALRRYATTDPDLQVVGLLDGERVVFGPEPGQRRLDPLDYWTHKLMLFRPVTATAPFCSVS